MLTDLSTLSKAFLDICLLRKGPQDLPKSSVLLTLCLILYTALDVLLTVQTRPFTDALLVSLVDVGFLLLVTFLILKQHRHHERWSQTMTALFGTGVILGIFIFTDCPGGRPAGPRSRSGCVPDGIRGDHRAQDPCLDRVSGVGGGRRSRDRTAGLRRGRAIRGERTSGTRSAAGGSRRHLLPVLRVVRSAGHRHRPDRAAEGER